jgi:hypothetical protein
MRNLTVVTECPEHGVESVEAEAAALVTPDGRVFTFSVDPGTGGLLVSSGEEGPLTVAVFEGADGKTLYNAIVLLTEPSADLAEIPPRRLN